ncbi:ATP-grasp domain-containing protein [Rhodothermus profundi]|uniref:Carbamoyl-phosphate synthase large subunit n=1 Tax=Rhodothermus profundi TaxID=633813 RepID=A0A1M6QCI3_9BACT|nr:ATP-grasp domain-containing protein [Rhodothermus profundi]SHK18004.1 carbamoyl-phosphate synthase large subunit [Rhodothermus profundi]
MKRILVTGAGGAAAANFIDSLRMAEEPFYIVGVDINPYHLACAEVESRYVVPRCTDPAYLSVLCRIIEREQIDLVHPQPDVEVAFLAAHREQIPARIFLPSMSAIRICHDKFWCNQVLAAAGVPVPKSVRITSLAEVSRAFEQIRSHSEGLVWVRAIHGAGSRAALPVRSGRQAEGWIRYWVEMKGLRPEHFMLSEFLPGREFAFQSLWYQGQLVTSMARERLEYLMGHLMPSGQSSSPAVARTVHRADVNEIATQAVKAVDPEPHGVYCVDLKENVAGCPCVTEINPGRFFTTSNFFSAAGCNMPYYYVRLALGESIPEVPPYNPVAEGLYWIRGVDRRPRLFHEVNWQEACVS